VGMIHWTLVGHFDDEAFDPRQPAWVRPPDAGLVARLLAEYPSGAAAHVELVDGYPWCAWAAGPCADGVYEFAHRLAAAAGCWAWDS
jgi:hypothetical protein